MGRFTIKRRVPRKVLKQQLAEANALLAAVFQPKQHDPGSVIVQPSEVEIARVTLGAHKQAA